MDSEKDLRPLRMRFRLKTIAMVFIPGKGMNPNSSKPQDEKNLSCAASKPLSIW
jgi:hypothetical protein